MPHIEITKTLLITPVRYKIKKFSDYKPGLAIFIINKTEDNCIDYWKTPYIIIPLSTDFEELDSLFTTHKLGAIYYPNDIYSIQIEDERMSPRFSIDITEMMNIAKSNEH